MYSVFGLIGIGFVAGILFGEIVTDTVLIFVLVFAALAKVKKLNISIILCVVFICIGALRCNSYINKDSILDDYSYEYTYVKATICDIPKKNADVYNYTVKTELFDFETAQLSHECHMRITSCEEYNFGDVVEFYGVLSPYEQSQNRFRFNTLSYYNSQGIFYKLYSEYSVLEGHKPSYGIGWLRNKLYNIISENEQNPDFKNIVSAVYLDFSPDTERAIYKLLLSSDTKRFLYSTRIHYILITFLLFIFSQLMVKRKRDFILLLFALVYCIINPTGGAGLRIMVCAAVMIVSVFLRGFHSFFDTISVAVILIGFVNPLIVLNSGFVISALSSISIYLFYRPVYWFVRKRIRIKVVSHIIAYYVVIIGIMLPVSAYMGFDLAIYSIFLLPVFTVIIAVMWLLFPLYILLPHIAQTGVRLCSWAIMCISLIVEKLPYHVVHLPRPSMLFLIIWYLAVFALRYKEIRKFFVLMCIAFCTVFLMGQVMRYDNCEVHFVSVGQGDGAVVSLPYRKAFLVDGGGTESFSDYDHAEAEYIPYLTGNGFSHIDAAFVSHYHEDHAIGIIHAINTLRVDRLYLPHRSENNEIYKQLTEAAKSRGTEVVVVRNSDKIDFGEIKVEVIVSHDEDLNESSAVYRFVYGDFEVLFTGDIGAETERDIVDSGYDISCDVLKVPHHGSKNSSSEEFLSVASPEVAIAGVGKNNVYGFPNNLTLERYKKLNIPFFSTGQSGNIVIESNKNADIKIYKN